MDKLVGSMVEEMALAIRAAIDASPHLAAGPRDVGEEYHGEKRSLLYVDGAFDLDALAQACAAIAQKRVNEMEALVEQMGGGCDANCGGLHSAMQQGREWFCPDCGLMLKRVAYVLPHVKPAVARAALRQAQSTDVGGEG